LRTKRPLAAREAATDNLGGKVHECAFERSLARLPETHKCAQGELDSVEAQPTAKKCLDRLARKVQQ